MLQYVFTCSTELLSGYAQIPWLQCCVSFVLIVNKCIHDTFIPQQFPTRFIQSPVRKEYIGGVTNPCWFNAISKYSYFFIAKHVEPGRGPRFLVVLVLFFVIIFQIQSQSFFFILSRTRRFPTLRNHITLSFTTGSFLATILVNLAKEKPKCVDHESPLKM